MNKTYPGEQWKIIKFDFTYVNDCRFEVSSFGRVRSFNKFSDGNILKGAMINGYPILRLKFFTERAEKTQRVYNKTKQEIFRLGREWKALHKEGAGLKTVKEVKDQMTSMQKKLTERIKVDDKARTIYYHSLIHRLVATYFLPRPGAAKTIVAHLDYNKLNNRSYNLKWMTPEENYEHQRNIPGDIDPRKKDGILRDSPTAKLSVTKVMLLKKLLNQKKPVRQLARQFKITETQVIRIRKGENWGTIKAAP